MSTPLLDTISLEIAKLLDPLLAAATDPGSLDRLLTQLGVPFSETTSNGQYAQLSAALTSIAALNEQLDALLAQTSISLKTLETAFDVSRQALTTVRALRGLGAATDVFAELGEELVRYLLGQYLRRWHPLAHSVAVLATLIEPAEERGLQRAVVENEQLIRAPVALDRFHFERLIDLLRDPVGTLRTEYGTLETPDALARKLFPRLRNVLRILGVPCRYGFDPDGTELLGDATAFVENALIIYADDVLANAPAEAGVVLNASPPDRGDLGLVLSPFGALNASRQAGRWTVDLQATGNIDAVAYGRHGLTLLTDSAPQFQAGLHAKLASPAQGPAYMLGSPTGSRLEIGGAEFKIDTTLSSTNQSLSVSADVLRSTFVIAPGDGDSFLSSLLPSDGLRTDFDLGLAWSSERGLTLRGSAGLETIIPLNKSFAFLKLSALYVSLQAQQDRVVAEVSTSMSATLGPVQVSMDRVGMQAALSFPESGGNLGVADLDLSFKPPSGLGLAIDASSVTGGGYLFHDAQKEEYSGVLQLQIADKINVKAFGMLTTQLPDNAKGYSLIVFITAEDFRPIQLGLGFRLLGFGGMLAINRTFNEVAMRAGLKNGTLATLLFPKDPVRNAPTILRNLATVFPAKMGSYLFGPLAKIDWAALISMDLALILEFGKRHRLIALGRISSVLPTRDKDLIRLNMDAVGILDFDQGTIELDAMLVDSRLLNKFVLTGAMALRACMVPGPRAGLALAVGGMNPHFTPPVTMPKLDRITINLTSGDNPRFTCEAYFAVTSNTVQFGSRASMYAGAYGFSIQGEVGFDVLIHLIPFHFLAEFYASIQLKRGSSNLFKVKVEGALEGPLPLRVKAKATFEILWCDFSIRFDKTLISGDTLRAVAAVNPLTELLNALRNKDNWSTQLPANRQHGVTLRKVPTDASLSLDPLGELRVKQSVLPLATTRDLDLFGGAPLAGARRFNITGATLNAISQTTRPVKDMFAPSQFFALDDDQKLSSPSFEELGAGVAFGNDDVSIDVTPQQRVSSAVEYESFIIDETRAVTPDTRPYVLRADRMLQQARHSAAARAATRTTGLARFRSAAAPAIKLQTPRWVVASTTDLNTRAPSSQPASWGDARETLKQLKRTAGAGKWQLVPDYETVT